MGRLSSQERRGTSEKDSTEGDPHDAVQRDAERDDTSQQAVHQRVERQCDTEQDREPPWSCLCTPPVTGDACRADRDEDDADDCRESDEAEEGESTLCKLPRSEDRGISPRKRFPATV